MFLVEKYKDDGYVIPDRDSQRIPKEEKRTMNYCKRVAEAIYSTYVRGEGFYPSEAYSQLATWREYALGKQNVDKYKDSYLGKSTNNNVLPIGLNPQEARKAYSNIDFSIMSPAPRVLDAIISRMAKVTDVVSVDAIDAESGAEKENMKWGTFAEGRFKEQLDFLRKFAGLPQGDIGYIPRNVDELNLYDAEGGFKQSYVIAMEQLLKAVMDDSRWDEHLVTEFLRDLCVGGFAMVEDVYDEYEGSVKARYCDPLYSGVQYVRDVQYNKPDWGYTIRFEKISNIRMRFPDLSEEEIYSMAKAYATKLGNPPIEDWSKVSQSTTRYSTLYDDFLIAVMHAKWIDVEYDIDVEHINRVGKIRTFPFQDGMRLGKKDKKTVAARRKMLYECSWVIDTKYCYDYGVARFQPRDGWADPQLPFHAVKTQGKPIIPRIIPALDLFQNSWLKLQQGLAMAVLSGYAIDMDALTNMQHGGQKLPPLEAIKMWRQTGFLFYKGTNLVTIGGQYRKPVEPLMGGAGTVIQDAMSGMEVASKLIEDMTGINPITLGGTPQERQGKAVTQFAVEGTNDVLSNIVSQINVLKSDLARNICLRLQHVVTSNKKAIDRYRNVIGDTRMELLKIANDGHDIRFGIRTHVRPTESEIQELFEMINLSLKNGRDGKVGITEADAIRFKSMIHSGASLKRVAQLLSFANQKAQEQAEAQAQRAQELNAQLSAQTEQQKAQIAIQQLGIEKQLEKSAYMSKALGDLIIKAYEKGDITYEVAMNMINVQSQEEENTQEQQQEQGEQPPTEQLESAVQETNMPSQGV